MSKAELLAEFAKLSPTEKAEVFKELWLTQWLYPGEPTEEEKTLLDAELDAFQRDGDPGSPWQDVMARLRSQA